MPDRVILFIDYQNVYKAARATFHEEETSPNANGGINPLLLGQWFVESGSFPRALAEVRVYRGQPHPSRDPRSHGAFSRQRQAWIADPRVTLVSRGLRYPRGWPDRCGPGERPQEKGIDVALAIDYVRLAIEDRYDVGILMSTDTDLTPALEVVHEMRSDGGPRVEVASWYRPGKRKRRLTLPEGNIWCHWLDKSCYDVVRDSMDYGSQP
ncbi:NYN domain-containing protein [Herbidospora galbida]|uniref:NYN domain-containing protein n=1 Tax=Herbidospora galbida TaxID=2575442 RepID=A0A4U3MJ14_9ACTN|nr:NYN domain-containing protein [Herbidospora galbida]TKK88880.1 NYN domain-containing protein [Herbidospora galbida]